MSFQVRRRDVELVRRLIAAVIDQTRAVVTPTTSPIARPCSASEIDATCVDCVTIWGERISCQGDVSVELGIALERSRVRLSVLLLRRNILQFLGKFFMPLCLCRKTLQSGTGVITMEDNGKAKFGFVPTLLCYIQTHLRNDRLYGHSYNVQVGQEIMRFLPRDICVAWSLLTSSGARPSVCLSVRHVGVLHRNG